MGKKSIFILSAIVLALFISCNLDNTQGIGSMVINDQYEESFRSSHIIGLSKQNSSGEASEFYSLYLKTDKGIRKYTNNGSGAYKFEELWGNGEDAKKAWIADDTGILVEDGNGEFRIIDLDGNILEDSFPIAYNGNPLKSIIDCYTVDGKEFTVLFGNETEGSTALYTAVADISSISVKDIPGSIDSVFKFYVVENKTSNISIIGDKAIRYSEGYSNSTNTAIYSYCNDITAENASFSKVENDYQKYALVGTATMLNNENKILAIDSSGRIYIDNSYVQYSNSGSSITKLPVISDTDRTMFIFNGKAIIYTASGATSKSATNLTSSMTPILLRKSTAADNRYLVMTELSGAYLITMNSDSSSITLTSLGKSDNTASLKEFF